MVKSRFDVSIRNTSANPWIKPRMYADGVICKKVNMHRRKQLFVSYSQRHNSVVVQNLM